MEPGVLLLPVIFPILSQINPGHTTQSTALTTTLILSRHLIVSIRGSVLPTGFPTKPHYKFFFPLYVSHHRPSLDISVIFPENYRAALCYVIFVQPYFTFSSLQPDVFLSTTILKHPQFMSFP